MIETVEGVTNADAIAAVPGVWRVFRREDLEGGASPDDPIAHAARLSYYSGRSGDIIIVPNARVRKGAHWTDKNAFNGHVSANPDPRSAWLFVWGRISYHDGFTPKRYTDFCHRYNLHGVDSDGEITNDKARYHEHGNGSDESVAKS